MDPELEGIALELLRATGCDDPPVDAFELAECCGLRVVYGSAARLMGSTITIPARVTYARRLHGLVAHELGHFALRRARLDDCEQSARYLAGALLVPAPSVMTAMRLRLTAEQMFETHTNASAEMICRRAEQVAGARVSVRERGRLVLGDASASGQILRAGAREACIDWSE